MIDRTEIIELAKQHGAIDSYPGSNDMIDRTEIIELAKQHGAIDSYPGSNDGIVEFAPDQLESFFHAAQRLALEGVGIIATVGATYPELMEYVQSELEAIRNRGTT